MKPITATSIVHLLLCFAVPGCANRKNSSRDKHPLFDHITETERAFELQRRADIVIDYEWPDRIRLWMPGKTTFITATEETLAEALAGATSKRELAVIIIGKVVRSHHPEPKLSAKVEAIDSILRAQNFTRVVFQLASATGRPIFRE